MNLDSIKTFLGMEPSVTYSFVERKVDDEFIQTAIKIVGGKYDRVIFSVGPSVSLKEVDDQMTLSYKYILEFQPPGLEIDHDELNNVIGDLLMEIIKDDVNFASK